MKTNELREIIRQVVVEEVQKQLPKILFEMLGNQSNKTLVKEENTTSLRSNTPVSINKPQNPVSAPRQMKKYSNNPILNQVLNETTPGIPQSAYGSSLVEVSDGGFQQIGNESMGILNESLVEERNIEPIPSNIPVQSNATNPVAAVNKVLNKDFRALMKKVDEKRKTGVGASNFSGALQSW